MQRARRLASIAVIAVLGTTVLSACRSDSTIAAYVGDRKITEDEVTKVLDDARSKVPPGGHVPSADPSTPPDPNTPPGEAEVKAPTRSEVVRALVMREVCKRFSAGKSFSSPERPPLDEWAKQQGLPPGSRYAEESLDLALCVAGVPQGEAEPTKEELQSLVALGRKTGAVPPDAKDDEAGKQLDQPQLRGGLALRNTLTQAVADQKVTINPRYRPLEYPVLFLSGTPAVSVTVGQDGPDTVIDAR
ncbi:hypothetical protein I0C86_19485 [Plantactinospora sp. S1510]|uniref:Lipoprotein n=1 Tax=Plantactinospora alkalitolerans TaxID=2789879 RepID=A0ABS0GY62_9ACTN|nr:hypothetical protein [Plantactinospora alkalitolerans]MBF9131126.1 hypothetical protein [Plantactinospora alkalitolerans]